MIVKYILRKGDETVEVLEGREARRDQLIAAGYEWVNRADFIEVTAFADEKPVFIHADPQKLVGTIDLRDGVQPDESTLAGETLRRKRNG